MQYRVDKIIEQIKTALDHNNESDQLITINDRDQLSLDDIILSKIIPAVRFIEENCPLQLLSSGLDMRDYTNGLIRPDTTQNICMCMLDVPDNFMRLLTFQMSDWKRPGLLITDEDPLYQQQASAFIGVRGNPDKPVVALVHYYDGDSTVNAENGLVLEVYSSNQSATIKKARYLALPEFATVTTDTETYDVVDIAPKVKTACVLYAAGLVAQTIGDTATQDRLMAEAYKQASIVTNE